MRLSLDVFNHERQIRAGLYFMRKLWGRLIVASICRGFPLIDSLLVCILTYFRAVHLSECV